MYWKTASAALVLLSGLALAQNPIATLERTINLATVGQIPTAATAANPTNPAVLAANLTKFALNPQGRFLVSGSSTGQLLVWDLQARRVIGRLEGHRKPVNALAYSRDGTRLVSGDMAGNVRFWNMTTRTALGSISVGEVEVLSLAYSPNGQRVALGGDDGNVRVIDAVNRRVLGSMKGHSDYVRSVAFSPNNSLIASGSDDETVRLWNAATRTQSAILRGHTDYVRSVAFSPNGQTLATASDDETIRLWNVATRRESGRLTGSELFMDSLSFSRDGRYLAAAETDGDAVARIWNLSSRQVLRTLPNEPELYWVEFNASGQLYAAAEDNTIRAYSLQGQETLRLSGAYGPRIVEEEDEEGDSESASSNFEVSRVTLDAAGNVLIGYFNQSVWDSINTQTWAVTRNKTGGDTSDLASAGSTTYVFENGEFIGLWEEGKPVSRLATPTSGIQAQFAQVNPDGTLLGVVPTQEDEDDVAYGLVFDLRTGRAKTIDTRFSLVAVAMSPDNQTVAFGGEGKLGIWNVDGTKVHEFELGDSEATVLALRYSPDGSLLAAGLSAGKVVVYNVASKTQVAVLERHEEDVYDVVFSPDSKYLVSASQDKTAIIWNVGDYRALQTLQGHTKGLGSLTFSSDGTRLFTGAFDSTVRVWKIAGQ